MESYSYKMYSSSFSSSSSFAVHPQEEKKEKPYNSSLRRVRSLPSKPITKKPIAPSPPIPPKIYRVEAVNFRDFVQMLTAAPEFQSHSNSPYGFGSGRLQEVAPPPLDLSPISLSSNNNSDGQLKEFLPPSSSKNSMIDDINY
uniref:VQ motif-containing protein 29 n=1 Tax=Nicotiana tabacum TaxID=4097 RepID=A0A1S4D6G7_TOBAC|nr:PREDICTED: VQ motif-containing protein 29-like [Nicotiana tabacum]